MLWARYSLEWLMKGTETWRSDLSKWTELIIGRAEAELQIFRLSSSMECFCLSWVFIFIFGGLGITALFFPSSKAGSSIIWAESSLRKDGIPCSPHS